MSETATLPKPSPEAPAMPPDATDILLYVVVAFLAPMFLTGTGGDLNFARMAAIGTLKAYRAHDQSDLMAIALIIASGLTALDSLSLSLADDISLPMILRLRGNAVALNRVADMNRRTLHAAPAGDLMPRQSENIPAVEPIDERQEAEVLANVAAAQKLAAEAVARMRNAPPLTEPPPPPPVVAQSPTAPVIQPARIPPPAAIATVPRTARAAPTQQQWQTMLASAMTDVAAEYTADLQNLPPAERVLASRRAALLSSVATEVMTGNIPSAPRPGDINAMIRPNTT